MGTYQETNVDQDQSRRPNGTNVQRQNENRSEITSCGDGGLEMTFGLAKGGKPSHQGVVLYSYKRPYKRVPNAGGDWKELNKERCRQGIKEPTVISHNRWSVPIIVYGSESGVYVVVGHESNQFPLLVTLRKGTETETQPCGNDRLHCRVFYISKFEGGTMPTIKRPRSKTETHLHSNEKRALGEPETKR